MIGWWLFVGLASAPLAADAGAAVPDESEEIRILLEAGGGGLSVTGEGLTLTPRGPAPATLESADREGARPQPAGDRIELRCLEGQVSVGPRRIEGTAVVQADGPLRVLGRGLRGRLEISCAGERWTALNVLPLESYLSAVLGGEMPPSFPLEALKAQAVAARSYALMRKIDARDQGRPYHLNSTVLSQVYAGLAREDPRTAAAVKATQGEVLALGMTPVEAYFHASCGGLTESGAAALGRPLPYLKSVACPCAGHSPYAHWRIEVSAAALARAVGLARAEEAEVVSRTSTGRAARVRVRGPKGTERTLAAVALRAALGYQLLPSTWFTLAREGQSFVFEGRGAGHGAGLCQWGARILAEQGRTYREILAHYYPGTSVEKIY